MVESELIKKARDAIQSQIREVKAIVANALAFDETTLGFERLAHWKTRTTARLREDVNAVEADRFAARMKRSVRFGDAMGTLQALAAFHAAVLVALDKDLQHYPEHLANPIPLVASAEPALEPRPATGVGRDVFIVQGHDDAAHEQVARTVEKLGLNAIVLDAKPITGQPIIGKFEKHADTAFALVLLTADDRSEAESVAFKRQPGRVRQTAIFELGYLFAKLGQGRVCVLCATGVEHPSDVFGIAYVELDAYGAWMMKVGRELKSAGMDVDLNNLA